MKRERKKSRSSRLRTYRVVWRIDVEATSPKKGGDNFGWRSLDGRKDAFSAETGRELLEAVLPRTDCTFVDEENGEPLYWSNKDGWVDKESATVFMDREKKTVRLPVAAMDKKIGVGELSETLVDSGEWEEYEE